LVAFIHIAIGTDVHHTPSQSNFLLMSITYGILEKDEANERTFPILDDLASISVSQPTSQVVAIGFQRKQHNSKICFTVAENGNVQKGLVQFLSTI